MKNEAKGRDARPRILFTSTKNAVSMWDETAKKTARLWWLYVLGVFVGLGILTLLHLWISPFRHYPHWALSLAVDALSAVGFAFAWIGAWRAHSADRRTKELLDKLEETNTIVRKSPRVYEEVFDHHALRLLNRASALESEARTSSHINLLLSTPAYGYHVLGMKAHQEFQKALRAAECNMYVFLFSPDAHYFHFANTLLWGPLTASSPRRPESLQITPNELLDCIRDTIDILSERVRWYEKTLLMPDASVPAVSVWIRNEAAFRLTSFESTAESAKGPEAYVVLTDPVNLTSDLRRFTGRLLAIPNSLFRLIVGFHNDPESFIESLKHCPYSSLSGNNARLFSSELETLKYDYFFLRTEHVLFDTSSFEIQCRRAIAIACQDSLPDERLTMGLTSILPELVSYFRALTENTGIAELFAPKQSRQLLKLTILPILSDVLKDSQQRHFSDIAKDLRNILLTHLDSHPVDSYVDVNIRKYLESDDRFTPWFANIYYLITSGFRDSLLAPARRIRASDLDTDCASPIVSQLPAQPRSVAASAMNKTASGPGTLIEGDRGDRAS
jgi:hypothetical protein